MKNNFFILIICLLIYIFHFNPLYAEDEFKFNITEIEITENGELILGSKGGKAITEDGFEIIAENFNYNKLTNILVVFGDVKLISKEDDVVIFSDKATYLKNDEIVFTEGNSKAINEIYEITAENFKFKKRINVLEANKNVKFFDKKDNTLIFSDKATYLKNEELILTEGSTKALVDNKFKFDSKDVKYSKKIQQLSSKNKSSIKDENGNIYKVDNFNYQINKKILKAQNVNVLSAVGEDKQDKYFFSEGFFDFDKDTFVSKQTKIKIHKTVFDDEKQDPRIYGSSSYGDVNSTVINKGIFTSCSLNNSCPPWSIKSEKIIHDKVKRDMIYKNAILKIYDVPVLYFPKFFHPDATVKRRSGFLQPQFNSHRILGSSIYIPYFRTFGDNQDYTFKPTLFEDKVILQNEFRKVTKDSSLITDFSLTKGYKSSVNNKKKNINHLFLKYGHNLNLPSYLSSELNAKIERVNNDTYLKVFQNNLFKSPVMPTNRDVMVSELNLDFDHNDYNLTTGIQVIENLGLANSDRYQYVLPSYDFSRSLDFENLNGSLNFFSSGSNRLKDTNNLRTSIVNDFEFNSINYLTDSGFVNNFKLYFKNLNSLGKNDTIYKSRPSVDAMGIAEINASLPMIKNNNSSNETLTPKISFRVNPGNNMKNHSTSNKLLDPDNIFEINRLGLSDSFEAGKSLTLGINYKFDIIENDLINNDISEDDTILKDKFLEFKLATVLRDREENEIPTSSTIDKKNSGLFGSINNQLFDNLELGYDFIINKNYDNFESHTFNSKFSINNFVTEFDYVERTSNLGADHVLSNKTSYEVDENNILSFSTRRNKEINLTEYYDLSYEYKNDCLTAGIKYNKTFYQDNDLKPSENLFFTITLIPLTTYERIIYEN